MDRRTFLKTLASFGASVALPANLATAAPKEIDAAWKAASLAWDLFEVSEYGTLSYANFEEPTTRYDAYGFDSPSDAMLESHYDLYTPIQKLYRQYLLEQDPAIADRALDAQVARNWLDWSSKATGRYQTAIDDIIDAWFSAEPDPSHEWDELYSTCSAQGAAYERFLGENCDMLDALGIVIIEGQCPGSSYYAAELRIDVDEANEIARQNGWSIRFVWEGAT